MYNYYVCSIIILSCILIYKNCKPTQENFIGPIVKPLRALGNFVTNFPVIFGVLTDAIVNFVLNFVDIFLSLFDVLAWIINLPSWVIEGFFFLITALSDIITIMILWLNPITMVKGVIKLIIFMVKLIIMTIVGFIAGVGRSFGQKLINSLRNGLWGLPHGPEQHLKHKDAALLGGRFASYQYGLYTHHHDHGSEKPEDIDSVDALLQGSAIENGTAEIYHPMRCYKGIGANNYLNIIAIIICPPLGVFMSYGLSGIFKILVCAGLSLIYYFPGLIYALMVTTHLGIGRDIDSGDCGGVFGGMVVEGCPKRKTQTDCNEATVPGKKDANRKELKACVWVPDEGAVTEEDREHKGKCFNVHFRYSDYDKMKLNKLTNEEIAAEPDKHKFNIGGNTKRELMDYQWGKESRR